MLSQDEEARRRVAVVGDMLELGERATELHREVGRHAAALDLGLLVGVGALGAEIVAGAREAGMAGCSARHGRRCGRGR